eukprot:tig00000217_g19140.t1
MMSLPSLDNILSDSRYLGSLLTLGAVAYMSPARYYLLRILLAQFAGYYFAEPDPSDIDTLQIKGVYLELDTTAIPDPTAAKTVNVLLMDVPDLNVTTISNVNACINKVVIPTWGHDGLENTILYWFEVPMAVRPNYVAYDKFQELRVRFTDITGATKKNNAFIVKNFGLWAYAK